MISDNIANVDVLCVGVCAYDLTFRVYRHPAADEKTRAASMVSCGGGPAANAAVTVSRLGLDSAVAGYVGSDHFGDLIIGEFTDERVNVEFIQCGSYPTPVSAVLVKPGGHRSVIHSRDSRTYLVDSGIDLNRVRPKVILFDGHEPDISVSIARDARSAGIETVLDAGSLHDGTRNLLEYATHLVASEKFALDYTGSDNAEHAMDLLSSETRSTVITLGHRGIIWINQDDRGALPAFDVDVVDTTGAGDVFHGAFAACLVRKMNWNDSMMFASAAAALSCRELGSRPGIPSLHDVNTFLDHHG